MHAAWSSTLAILGEAGKRAADLVTDLSQKSLTLRHYKLGALVPAHEFFDAISRRSVSSDIDPQP